MRWTISTGRGNVMTKNTGFIPEKSRKILTTGRTIALLRELKAWTQKELAHRSGIIATNISLLENNKINIGKKRAVQLAKAFGIHPALIMFPECVPSNFIQNVA